MRRWNERFMISLLKETSWRVIKRHCESTCSRISCWRGISSFSSLTVFSASSRSPWSSSTSCSRSFLARLYRGRSSEVGVIKSVNYGRVERFGGRLGCLEFSPVSWSHSLTPPGFSLVVWWCLYMSSLPILSHHLSPRVLLYAEEGSAGEF